LASWKTNGMIKHHFQHKNVDFRLAHKRSLIVHSDFRCENFTKISQTRIRIRLQNDLPGRIRIRNDPPGRIRIWNNSFGSATLFLIMNTFMEMFLFLQWWPSVSLSVSIRISIRIQVRVKGFDMDPKGPEWIFHVVTLDDSCFKSLLRTFC